MVVVPASETTKLDPDSDVTEPDGAVPECKVLGALPPLGAPVEEGEETVRAVVVVVAWAVVVVVVAAELPMEHAARVMPPAARTASGVTIFRRVD